eukprot:241830-Alexandrium_andersonii.AAC.1
MPGRRRRKEFCNCCRGGALLSPLKNTAALLPPCRAPRSAGLARAPCAAVLRRCAREAQGTEGAG